MDNLFYPFYAARTGNDQEAANLPKGKTGKKIASLIVLVILAAVSYVLGGDIANRFLAKSC